MPARNFLTQPLDGPAEAQIQQILEAARTHLNMDVGFVSEFVDGQRVFRFADSASPSPVIVGNGNPLEESYCYYITRGLMPQVMTNAADDPIASSMPVTKALPVGAHISTPIRLADGGVYGTLCYFSYEPDGSLNSRDLNVLRMCADLVGRLIQQTTAQRDEQQAKRARITNILDRRAVAIVYQPIYRLIDDRLMNFEALSRFASEPLRSPDKWFAEAADVGLDIELEYLAVEEALVGRLALPQTVSLSFNLSPKAIMSPRFGQTFDALPVDRLILELTEHAAIGDYAALNAALANVRSRGLRLAIDDVGAGHSSFRHVVDLRPDLIKLDMGLTRDVDSDEARHALAESITRFGRRMGCEVVAEGVETRRELDALRDIGVTKVQGYLTGKPMPLAQVLDLAPRGVYEGSLMA